MLSTAAQKKREYNRLRMSNIGEGARRSSVQNRNKSLYNQTDKDRQENMELLDKASAYYFALQNWRDRNERAWRYLNGKQWEDLVYDPDSLSNVKEKDLIKAQGQIPFVVNMLAPLVENILGQFLSARSRSSVIARSREDGPLSEMLTKTLWSIQDANSMWDKDADALKIALFSAAAIQRLDYGRIKGKKKPNVIFKNMEFSSMFFNPVLDADLDDMTMIGAFWDLPVNNIVSTFAKSKSDEGRIREMFSHVNSRYPTPEQGFTEDQIRNKDFFFSNNNNKGRVFEIWEQRGKWKYVYHDPMKGEYNPDGIDLTPMSKAYFERENANRIKKAQNFGIINIVDGMSPLEIENEKKKVKLIEYREKFVNSWYYKYVTSNYETLQEGESPFTSKEHPFAIMFHSLIRGETMSFIETIIDIQRGFNRDKILLDFVIGASAKGALVIDENSISDDFPFEQIADTWTKRNGVIKLKLKVGAQMPQQLASKALPAGLNESLNLGMSLMNQMGGVSDALQGRNPGAGVPASRYAQEAQNSTLNIKNRLDAFNRYRSRRDKMALDIALQYYGEKRYLPISGNNKKGAEFEPDLITEDLEYDMSVGQGSDSQIYRAIMDDKIDQYIIQGLIPLEVGVKSLSYPGVDKLLDDLEEYKQSMNPQGLGPDGQPLPNDNRQLPPSMSGGIVDQLQDAGADASQANPESMELMKRYAGVA